MASNLKLDRLQSQLLTSGLQNKNPPLYQVINQIIASLREIEQSITGSGGGSTGLANLDFITSQNDVSVLPNSRQLLGGNFVNINLSTVNAAIVNGSEWSVLTNGDPVSPELIFAGGDVIMTHTP